MDHKVKIGKIERPELSTGAGDRGSCSLAGGGCACPGGAGEILLAVFDEVKNIIAIFAEQGNDVYCMCSRDRSCAHSIGCNRV